MIFRKNKPESTQPQAQAQADVPTQVVQQPAPEMPEQQPLQTAEPPAAMPSPGGNASLLTSDVVMEGNLLTSGELHLDGTIHGAVQASRVIIDVNGAVNGQVVAQEIIVRGRAIGPICGVRIELAPGAQVQGDVISQSIVVQDGAFIDGQIRHSEDPLGEWQQMWQEAEVAADDLEVAPELESLHGMEGAASAQAENPPQHAAAMAHEPVAEEAPAPYLRPAGNDTASNSGGQKESTAREAGDTGRGNSEKAAEKPGEKPAGKPDEKPAGKPAEKPGEENVDKNNQARTDA